jgi:hypothetical protein
MKSTLEFNLDDPDDRMSNLRSFNSLGMALALHEITYNLKKKIHNRIDEYDLGNECIDIVDSVFEDIRDIMEDNGLNIDELI